MKKVILAIFAIMTVLCLESASANTATFVDDETGICFSIPDNWFEVPNVSADETIKIQIAPDGYDGLASISFAVIDYYAEMDMAKDGINRKYVDYYMLTEDAVASLLESFEYEDLRIKSYGENNYVIVDCPLELQKNGLLFKATNMYAFTMYNGYFVNFYYTYTDDKEKYLSEFNHILESVQLPDTTESISSDSTSNSTSGILTGVATADDNPEEYSDETGVRFTCPEGWELVQKDLDKKGQKAISFSFISDPQTILVYFQLDYWELVKEGLASLGYEREDVGFEFLDDYTVALVMEPYDPKNLQTAVYNGVGYRTFEYDFYNEDIGTNIRCRCAMTMHNGYLHMIQISSPKGTKEYALEFKSFLNSVFIGNGDNKQMLPLTDLGRIIRNVECREGASLFASTNVILEEGTIVQINNRKTDKKGEEWLNVTAQYIGSGFVQGSFVEEILNTRQKIDANRLILASEEQLLTLDQSSAQYKAIESTKTSLYKLIIEDASEDDITAGMTLLTQAMIGMY